MEENAVLESGGSTGAEAENNSGGSIGEAMSGLESLKYKTTSGATSSNDNSSDVGDGGDTGKPTDSDSADSKDSGDGEKTVDKENVIDPEIADFLKEKNIDIGELSSNDTVMGLVNSLRDSEAEKTKIQNEHQLESDAMARKKAEANVDKVLEANKTDVPTPLSPLKQVQDNYVNTVDGLMNVLGIDTVDSFVESYPDLYEKIKGAYEQGRDEAQTQEYQWHKDQEANTQAQKEAADAVQREHDTIKTKAADRITEAKKDYPEIAEDFEKFGINKFIDTFAELTKVPVDYFVAESGFFDFISKASSNARIVEDIPEMESKIKKSLEKQIRDTKKAETVSSDDLLPDDHKAAASLSFMKSFNNIGRGTRV